MNIKEDIKKNAGLILEEAVVYKDTDVKKVVDLGIDFIKKNPAKFPTKEIEDKRYNPMDYTSKMLIDDLKEMKLAFKSTPPKIKQLVNNKYFLKVMKNPKDIKALGSFMDAFTIAYIEDYDENYHVGEYGLSKLFKK